MRSKLFDRSDPNGTGYLSLAETDKGIREVLGLEGVNEAKPAIMRAFTAAKNAGKCTSEYGVELVAHFEFRLLLLYLGKFYELFEKFKDLESTHDKRISRAKLKTAVKHLEKWGIKIDNPDTEFDSIDEEKGGIRPLQ